MVSQLQNIESLTAKKRRKVAEPVAVEKTSKLIDRYQEKYFNSRNMYIGRLISTTDRVQQNNQTMIKRLHKMLDRVELDRPYLFKDKLHIAVRQ